MKVTPNLIDKLEAMSALSLSEEQKEQMSAEITQMLGFMEQIKGVNTDNDGDFDNVISIDDFAREDEIKESTDVNLALSNAKNTSDNFFVVPKVVD